MSKYKFRTPEYIYHVTKKRNVSSIKKHGLIPEYRKGITGGRHIPDVVELASDAEGLEQWAEKKHPDNYKVLKVRTDKLDKRKLKRSNFYVIYSGGRKEFSTWFTYHDKIPPEAISELR